MAAPSGLETVADPRLRTLLAWRRNAQLCDRAGGSAGHAAPDGERVIGPGQWRIALAALPRGGIPAFRPVYRAFGRPADGQPHFPLREVGLSGAGRAAGSR